MVNTSSKTAMYMDNPSNATKKLVSDILANGKSMPIIFDFGAGNGRNARYIAENTNAIVLAYDPNGHPRPVYPVLQNMGYNNIVFDYVLCSFVANVLPKDERDNLFERLDGIIYHNLIIEVRTIADISKIKRRTRYSDGYKTSRGTFQRGFEPADLEVLNEWFGEHGRIFTKTHHAISFIWRQSEAL